MAQFYKITEATPLGEPWNAHGKDIQTWWCKVEGEELGVSVGKQVGNQLSAGQQIYGELVKTVSGKGKEYWKFRGSQIPEGVSPPTSNSVGSDEVMRLLQDNNRRLKILMGEEEAEAPKKAPEVDAGSPIDLGDIPF